MPSEFATLFAGTGLPAIMAAHGESGRVALTPAGGSSTPINAVIIGDEQVENGPEGTGQVVGYKRELTFARADVTTLRINSKITVDGVQYSIRGIPAGGSEMVTVQIYRGTAGEVTRPDYREREGL